ncbi:MAG: vitamin K epoxide reductase family protein [Candidatus Harrisonbacteria bacterium]|nr:vitamin K epoxide reductase family protein [Candidatus Harrisonbacteria bacterium]MBI2604402.1 vitamin K epoxide reductase family protein [Candidatus Harrisonbacteria bacterium]
MDSVFIRRVASFFLALGGVGLFDSTYLTFRHFSVTPGACLLGEGCNNVLASAYSTFHGIPVALFGVFYYSVIIALAIAALWTKNPRFMLAASAATLAGLFASAWFVYVQLVLLKEICAYCMASAATSTLLFVGGVVVAWQYFLQANGIAKIPNS